MGATVPQLREKIRRRADVVGNDAFQDDAIDDYLNAGWHTLYDLLVTMYEDYRLVNVEFDTVAGQEVYEINTLVAAGDPLVYKARGVDHQITTDRWIKLQNYEFPERDRYDGPPTLWQQRSEPFCYRFEDESTIRLKPLPAGGRTLRAWYVPQAFDLEEAPTDPDDQTPRTLPALPDYVQKNWVELIVLEAALLVAAQEEGIAGNIPILTMLRDKKMEQIRGSAPKRNAGDTPRAALRADRERGLWTPGFGRGGFD